MVPALLNPVIMGLPWIREDNVIIRLVINTLIINSYGLKILIKIIPISSEIKESMATLFIILIKGARKRQNPLIIFKVLLEDITKALRFKITRTPMKIRKLLPAQYYDHLPPFEGDMAAELSLHRLGIDHIFTLEKGENG